MSSTITQTAKTTTNQVISKEKELQKATASGNLDEVLKNVKKLDITCPFTKCKKNTEAIAIVCKYCHGRFCTTHGMPEIHGCGDAVRRDEKRQYLHPITKLTKDKHEQASTKLNMKLKQKEFERKSKQGVKNKK